MTQLEIDIQDYVSDWLRQQGIKESVCQESRTYYKVIVESMRREGLEPTIITIKKPLLEWAKASG